MNRILADQDSKFGINMLGLDLNEDEEDEVAHLKSMGFTAIESLTAVFERRMVIKVRPFETVTTDMNSQ